MRQHRGRARALQQGEAGDVLDDVRDSNQREGDERDREGGVRRDEQHRPASARDREPEGPRQPTAPHEHQREDRTEQAADPDRGVQVADPARAEMQELQRADGQQHAHRAVHQRLG